MLASAAGAAAQSGRGAAKFGGGGRGDRRRGVTCAYGRAGARKNTRGRGYLPPRAGYVCAVMGARVVMPPRGRTMLRQGRL